MHHGSLICLFIAPLAAATAMGCEAQPDTRLGRTQQAVTVTSTTPCGDNPCDPRCQRMDGAPPPGGLMVPTSGTSMGGSLGSLPGGFVNKGLKDSAHPPKSPCTGPQDCQFDHYCDISAGLCVPWGPGEFDEDAGGPDLTMGVPCDGAIPVCNRGSSTASAGAEIIVIKGNSSQLQRNLGRCTLLSGKEDSRCVLSSPVEPGQCVSADDCLPLPKGTKGLVVNSPAFSSPTVSETDCSNNWSVSKAPHGSCGAGSLYTTYVYEETYLASCPAGQGVQWSFLAFAAETPSNASGPSTITVQAHTGATESDIAPDCDDCVTLAQVPITHPETCLLGSMSPCPVDLYTEIGSPGNQLAALELVFTLEPTPDGLVAPMLDNWQVRFTCIDNE